MTLELPDIGLSEAEIRFALAYLLFQRKNLTIGQAAELAGTTENDFRQRLGIPQPDPVPPPKPPGPEIEDFEQDMRTLRSLGRL